MDQYNVSPLAYGVPGACRRLSVGKTKLYELINRGELMSFKLDGKTMVAESECQRLVRELMDKGRDPE